MGDSLLHLKWENAIAYDDAYTRNKESLVSAIVSRRLGLSIDPVDQTFVELGRFTSPGQRDIQYQLVLNKRTDSTGDRHITVKLTPGDVGASAWTVTNVLTKQSWLVKALSDTNPDTTDGFTDFFSAGAAGLYRLEPQFPYKNDPNPSSFSLLQNYPNPFSTQTTIVFTLPHSATVTLKIYDVLGREVLTPLDGIQYIKGTFAVPINLNTTPGLFSGVYFYRINAGEFTAARKMVVVR